MLTTMTEFYCIQHHKIKQPVKNVIWYGEEKHEQDIPNIVTSYLLHYTVHNIQFH
jgi:hypothetical protein